MAKTPSSRLFDLIKVLSGSEKRYFKMATKKDVDNKYLRLFEAIEQQTVFDDHALKKIVYDGEEVKGKKYSELKSYLYHLILRHLQQFDDQNSVDYQLKSMLLSVRSLFRRLLYKDCKYILARAKKIALRYENFSIALDILNWEKELAYAQSDVDYLDKHLKDIQIQEASCLANMEQVKEYEFLFYKLFLSARTNTPQSKKLKEKVEHLAAHPLLADEKRASSFHAKVLYYRIHTILSYQRRNIENFYEQSKQLIPFIESKPFLLKENVSHYISALSNLTVSCGFIGKHEEMRACLKRLKKIHPNTLDDELKIHRQYYTNYFSLCIRTGAFKEGHGILQKHFKEVKSLDSKLFRRNSFLFQYFYISFGFGQYDEALKHLNQWLNLPRSAEQRDLQVLARLLNLIVHYEIANNLLLDSLLKSTQRRLQKSKHYNAFEHLLFHCLRQANHLVNKREKKGIFSATVEKVMTAEWSSRERAMLRFFDFEAWLLSKAQNRAFSDIIREKSEKNQSISS